MLRILGILTLPGRTTSRASFERLFSMSSLLNREEPGSYLGAEEGEVASAVIPPRPSAPVLSRKLQFPNPYVPPQECWLESLSTVEEDMLGIIDLHPDIFGIYPRLDSLHKNVVWQILYKKVNYEFAKSRAEMRGGGRKPWPQKGTGRARHGSVRSPIWHKGGAAMGPRGPKPYFYMLSTGERVLGLRSALSAKLAQNDLHVVDSLDMPSDDPQYAKDLAECRRWGCSVLFVDDSDVMPRNISLALNNIPSFNLMPVFGLNVYSMLKHETLVLTLAAVNKLEDKLLHQLHKTERNRKFSIDKRHVL